MLAFAPRFPRRLLEEIERQSRRSVPIAEMNRRVGAYAARHGLHRPSYEQVRALVHESRALRWAAPTSTTKAAVDVAFHVSPPEALLRSLAEPPALRLRDRVPRA